MQSCAPDFPRRPISRRRGSLHSSATFNAFAKCGVPLVIGLLLLGMGATALLQDIPGMHEVINGTTAGIAVLLVVFLVLPLFLVCNGFLMLRREGRRLSQG